MHRRMTATAVAIATILFTTNLGVFAAPAASLVGRVTEADGVQPRAGVVVAIVGAQAGATYRSTPTDARGAFRIEGAPAGSYHVAVEADGGAFVASKGIALKNGDNPALSLALAPALRAEGEAPAPKPAPKAKVMAPWVKWVIVGGIVLGGALVVNAVTDNEEASPFGGQ